MIKNKYFKNEILNNKIIVDIPQDWYVKKLGNILNGIVGTTPPKNNAENFIGDLEWINISDMGNYEISSNKKVNRNAKGVKQRIIESNSLLYSFKLSVGQIGFNKNEAMTNEAIISFQPSKNKDNNLKYFYYVLKKYLHLNADSNVYGADIMNQEKIKDTDLVLTENKEEQNKIVEFLDKQQSLIDSYKEKLSLLEKQESYYQEEFLSGRIRIKLNSESEQVAVDKGFIIDGDLVSGKEKEFEEWLSVDFKDKVEFYKDNDIKIKKIGEKSIKLSNNLNHFKYKELFNSMMGKTILKKDLYEKGIPVYSATEKDEFFGYVKNSSLILSENDLVVPARGNSIGYVKMAINNSTATQTTICSLSTTNNSSLYVYYYLYFLKNKKIIFNLNGGAIPQLTVKEINDFDLYLPYLIEQYLIVAFFKNILNNKKNIKEKIKIEEEKMEYLLENLLTGKIRVE